MVVSLLQPAAAEVDRTLRFLQSPAAYGVRAHELAWIETHMSWVFLVRDQAFKLRKPLRTRYVDHSSLAAREAACREELRLNAPLAPGVCLGLMAVLHAPGGDVLVPEDQLPGPGRAVEWLLHMRRLPDAARLDRRIARREVASDEIDALAERLVGFYRAAAPLAASPRRYLKHFEDEQRVNREVLLDRRWSLRHARGALDGLDVALARQAAALGARAAGGHLLDGHGDLRPEHVFMTEPPVVIDRLEFSAGLRCVDPFDELASLGLECEMAGADWVGRRLHDRLRAAGALAPPLPLIELYTAARALLRARLAMEHLLDEAPRQATKWQPLAERYIARAHALLRSHCPHAWP